MSRTSEELGVIEDLRSNFVDALEVGDIHTAQTVINRLNFQEYFQEAIAFSNDLNAFFQENEEIADDEHKTLTSLHRQQGWPVA